MRVALVLPKWKIENPYPPLGLAYIGAVLEEDGHIVKIVDLTLDSHILLENKMREIIEFIPDIVGISVMTHSYANAIKVAEYLKNKTNALIVFGGPHPTIMPEETLSNLFIDFVIIGEGEYTFLKLCQTLQQKDFDALRTIDGLCYKDGRKDNGNSNENIVIRSKNNFIEDLDKIPFPARHLLKLDSYKLIDDHGKMMTTIISSRGCPYKCTYCYKGIFGVSYRQRSPKNIIDEIVYCKEKFGYTSFYFVDDLFTLNSKRVEQLAIAIKRECIDISWQCLARVNNATPKMFKHMKESGCYKVHFGIESGNQNVINRVKKGITINQVRNAVKYCKDAGIKTKGYFMVGMPGDTIDTMRDTLDFAKELELDDVMFSITTPFPGTELWKIIDKSKIKNLSNAFYFDCTNSDIDIFYNLSDARDEDIIKIMRKAHKISDRIRTKNICNELFGKNIGFLAWQLSKIYALREAGKLIIGRENMR